MKKYNYWGRLKKACEYRGIDVNAISKLVDEVRKRASGDRVVDSVFHPIIHQLEPQGCGMSHCTYFTSYGFCNCNKGLVPIRCKKYREFLDRQYDRMQKVYLEGREDMKNLAHPSSCTCPYKRHDKRIHDRYKYDIFCQGVMDEYNGLPMRSMKTGKLELEWGIPTAETVDEYYFGEIKQTGEWSDNFYDVRDKLKGIAEKLELSQFEIWRKNDFDIDGKVFITKITKPKYWQPKKDGLALKKIKPQEQGK